MEEMKSGKKLCDDFFENITSRDDIDPQIASLLKDLYLKVELTKDRIIQGLNEIRKKELKNE